MAADQNGNWTFNVTYKNYWTVKVDGRVVETVLHMVAPTLQEKDVTGAGTGYLMKYSSSNDYKAYANRTSAVWVSPNAPMVIETGYATVSSGTWVASSLSQGITISGGSLSIPAGATYDATILYQFTVGSGGAVTPTVTP